MKLQKTEFQKKVYPLCKKILRGKVSTYKEIGKKLGKGQIYRAVGNALNKNPYSKVPCHRVICSDGRIGGFARCVKVKIRMLRKEGVVVDKNKVDLKKYLCKFK